MEILKVNNLVVNYGMIKAVKGASFFVNQGEIVALIGANGAGKTSILHTVTGLLSAKEGSIEFEGRDITKTKAHDIVKLGMAHVPEGRRVFGDLTVLENSEHISEMTKRALKTDLIKYIRDFRDLRRENLSLQVLSQAVSSRCLQWAEHL